MKLFNALKQQFGNKGDALQTDSTEPGSEDAVESTLYQGPVKVLKQLVPIGKLKEDELNSLRIFVTTYSPGSIIFNRGEMAHTLIYLISGEVYLETTGDRNFDIQSDTFEALHPLSSGDYRNATAIARKTSEVLTVPMEAMDLYRKHYKINPKQLLKLPTQYQGNQLLKRFISADNLQMPTLPDVAIKVRDAMQQDVGVAEIVKIVNLDPTISAKLIQVANSPIYCSANPITTCHNAVSRIGLHSTKNIVTSISLRSLYKNKRKELNVLAQKYWKQSIRISALSYTLAKLTRSCDPEEALLAGLISHIGIVPFLKYADSLPDEIYNIEEINKALPFVTGAVSALILDKWNFPENMKNVPLAIKSWYLSKGEKKADLADIVLLAKYHSFLGGKGTNMLPPITSLPSYAHIKNGELSPDKSLKILHDAKQQISETMQFFSA